MQFELSMTVEGRFIARVLPSATAILIRCDGETMFIVGLGH